MPKDFDESYYEETANRHGWGEQTAVIDPEREEYLKKLIKGKSVLDIGCATGVYVDMLNRQGFRASGVDFAPGFIEIAKKRYEGEFQAANALKLPFKDKSFDTVLLLDILEHIDDKKALNEAWRVASKRVIVVVPNAVPQEMEHSGLLFRDYLDTSHLRYYTREMMVNLTKSVKRSQVVELQGVAPVGFERFLRETISFPTRFITRVFFKIFFESLKLAKTKTYYSEWLCVLDKEVK